MTDLPAAPRQRESEPLFACEKGRRFLGGQRSSGWRADETVLSDDAEHDVNGNAARHLTRRADETVLSDDAEHDVN
jgi:hypothetical protein